MLNVNYDDDTPPSNGPMVRTLVRRFGPLFEPNLDSATECWQNPAGVPWGWQSGEKWTGSKERLWWAFRASRASTTLYWAIATKGRVTTSEITYPKCRVRIRGGRIRCTQINGYVCFTTSFKAPHQPFLLQSASHELEKSPPRPNKVRNEEQLNQRENGRVTTVPAHARLRGRTGTATATIFFPFRYFCLLASHTLPG